MAVLLRRQDQEKLTLPRLESWNVFFDAGVLRRE